MTPTESRTNPSEERVGIVMGDRLCTACGYNLAGQATIREAHYGLLIVRCPECGAVAPLQEYPTLGRWAGRIAMVLAGMWLLVVVGLFAWTVGQGVAFASGIAQAAASAHSMEVSRAYQAWRDAQVAAATPAPAPAPTAGSDAPSPRTITILEESGNAVEIPTAGGFVIGTPLGFGRGPTFREWWATPDAAALRANAGGWARVADWNALWLWIPMVLIAFVAGCIWALVLARRRARGLTIFAAVLTAFTLLGCVPQLIYLALEPDGAWQAARAAVGPPFLLGSIVASGLALWAGMLAGRPLARRVFTFALPPRMSSWLSVVWRADS